MKMPAGKSFIVELTQDPEKGLPWLVRVYRRTLGFKRQISSDWFLDENQATRFAHQLAKELLANPSGTTVKNRKPGWTLHPAAR